MDGKEQQVSVSSHVQISPSVRNAPFIGDGHVQQARKGQESSLTAHHPIDQSAQQANQ